jgi:hypothetical protein
MSRVPDTVNVFHTFFSIFVLFLGTITLYQAVLWWVLQMADQMYMIFLVCQSLLGLKCPQLPPPVVTCLSYFVCWPICCRRFVQKVDCFLYAGIVCSVMWDEQGALYNCVNCWMVLYVVSFFVILMLRSLEPPVPWGCTIVITMKRVYYLNCIFWVQKLLRCSCNHILFASTTNGVLPFCHTCLDPQAKNWCSVVSSNTASWWQVFEVSFGFQTNQLSCFNVFCTVQCNIII